MEVKISTMFKCHIDTETQLMKLSAWIQTLGFVLEGLDKEGTKASKNEVAATAFANRYPIYSEMLFLALSGLQDCNTALERLHEKERIIVKEEESKRHA